MGTKFTFFIVPDDDSETRSFSLGKTSIKILITVPFLALFGLLIVLMIYVPKISDYIDLSQKYDVLVSERMKVLDLTKNLKKIIHMDEFVRNSLGADFNFVESPKIIDSALMVIPENNIISYSDNFPSFLPVEGFISQRMENTFSNVDEAHGGIDIVAKEGTPISSAASGVVVFSGWTYEMGNLIIIYHGGGYMTHYGHNQNNLVSRLDMVKRGDVIGYVGNTGISSGPHLHFEIWKGDSSIDPLIYFPNYLKKDLTLKKLMSSSKFKNVHTMIGPDANVNGPINLKQGIIIYGKVYGDISTNGSIRIAKDGIVNGNIKCSNIVLGGTIIGDIQSEGSVTLKSTSKLKGDISYRKLHIEDGAKFEGQCDLALDFNAENMHN